MISMKKAAIAAACSTLLMVTPSLADTYTCTHGAQERTISVIYTNEGSPVPCEVSYTKDAATESLWRADNLVGFCEEKAEAFVEQQRAWGWDCAKQESQEAMKETVKEEVQNAESAAQETMQEKAQTTKEVVQEKAQTTKEMVQEKADDAMNKAK